MKYCKQCGAQMSDQAAFCPNCGTAAAKPEPAQPQETQATVAAQPPVQSSDAQERTVALGRDVPVPQAPAAEADRTVAMPQSVPVQPAPVGAVNTYVQTQAAARQGYAPAAPQTYAPTHMQQPMQQPYYPAARPSPLLQKGAKAPMLTLGALLMTVVNFVLMLIPHIALVIEDGYRHLTIAKAPVFSLLNVAYPIWSMVSKDSDLEEEIMDEFGDIATYITLAKVFYVIWFIVLALLMLSLVYLFLPMAKKKAVGLANYLPLLITTVLSFAIQLTIMIIAAAETKAYEDEIEAVIKFSAGGWIFIVFSVINIAYLCFAAFKANKERKLGF